MLLRYALPFLALALGVLIWDLVVRINDIQPYVLPSPGLVLRTLVADWSILWCRCWRRWTTTFEALLLAFVRRRRTCDLCSTSRGWSNIRSIRMR